MRTCGLLLELIETFPFFVGSISRMVPDLHCRWTGLPLTDAWRACPPGRACTENGVRRSCVHVYSGVRCGCSGSAKRLKWTLRVSTDDGMMIGGDGWNKEVIISVVLSLRTK